MSFSVPIDDLKPRAYQRLPNGKYIGTLAAVGERNNNSNDARINKWEALDLTIDNIRLPDGATEIVKGDTTINLKGQLRSVNYTTLLEPAGDEPTTEERAEKAQTAMRIGKQNITGAAWAVGLVEEEEDDDGKPVVEGFEFESTEDAVEQFEAGIGTEVGFQIVNRPQKDRNKQLLKDDEGNTKMTDEVTRIFPVKYAEA